MDHELTYLSPLNFSEGSWLDGNRKWIQLYPYDSWDHPFYGTTTIGPEQAQKFVENFNNKVRGQEIHSDYEHGEDTAKGAKASGKFVQVEVRDDGPWALVEFTEEAKKEIDAGEWNYWSTSHYDTWTHPQTGETHEYVLDGGGLTNKPFVKGMVPLNFSELMLADPNLKMHAVLSGKDKNDLPDSAFAYIEPGGKKDAEGKTVPRSLRHLPYKNSEGQIDLAHVRNALARLSGTQIPDSVKPKIKAMLQRHLAAQHAESAANVLETLETIPDSQFLIDDEDPFFESTDETTDTDEEGMDELLKKFRELFNLPEDADEEAVLKHASDMQTEIEPLRELKKEHSEAKKFSELFPEQAAELEEAREYRQSQEAKRFTESLADRRVTRKVGEGDDAHDEPTNLGFSSLVTEKAGELVKSFSEGKATVEQFKEFTESVLDNGIVDFGTHGSSREGEEESETKITDISDVREMRKKFSEKIRKLADEEFEGDTTKAYNAASERWPEEFEAYKTRKPTTGTAAV